MRKELTENLADVVTVKANITKSVGWHKNVLRPTKEDNSNRDSGRIPNRANKSVFIGVPGTKAHHTANANALKKVVKDDKITGRTDLRTTKNVLGRKVHQGKRILVKKKDVVEIVPTSKIKVPVKVNKELSKILGGI